MQTIKFSAEIGVNEGYNVDENQKETLGIEAIGKLVQEKADTIYESDGFYKGIYISTVVDGPDRTIYRSEWGCPEGGELTYNISGTANPTFGVDPVAWKIAALALVNKMRTALKQTTVEVNFTDQDGIDSYYLNSKEAFKDSVKQILQKEVEKGRSPQDIEKYTDIFEKE